MLQNMKILYVIVIASVVLSAVVAFTSFHSPQSARIPLMSKVPASGKAMNQAPNAACSALEKQFADTQAQLKSYQVKMAPAKPGGAPKKLSAQDQKAYDELVRKQLTTVARRDADCKK